MVYKQMTVAALAVATLAGRATAIDAITAKGQYLFYENGTQFFIKGVAYQQGIGPGGGSESGTNNFVDSIADTASCQRDITMLQKLGTNTIRVYALDPTADHTACMNALGAAGIYVIADLSSPGESINRDSPAWTTDLYARYTSVVDAMAPFDNTLGFFAGNEVTNNKTNSAASAYVKAAVRDTKAYIKGRNFGRWLGVGYATNDDADTRDNLANYFNCGEDQDAAIDFWGYNIYEWCGESTFESSGYEERTKAFANYSVPAFFSEYGCNNPGGGESRIWQETGTLYSSQMNKVWSGGIVYEYFQEQNDYGLVSLSGSDVTPRKDFQALADALADVAATTTDTGVTMAAYTATNEPRACPAVQEDMWLASDVLPPTPNATLCELMVASSSCVPSDAVAADPKKLGAMFGTLCGLDATACDGIASDATKGTYGQFSMCNATQKLAHALDTYYSSQNKAKASCDFSGQAKVVTPTVSASSLGSASDSGSSSSGSGSSVSSSPSGSPPSASHISSSSGGSSGSAASAVGSSSSSAGTASSTTSGGGGGGVVPVASQASSAGASTSNSNSNSASAASINTSSDDAANSDLTTQSSKSGSGTSGAGRITAVENAGWAGSLLIAVGVVALGL